MRCPRCDNEKSKVIRTQQQTHSVWRMRECKSCGHLWWTSEIEDEPLVVEMRGRPQNRYAQI